MQKRLVNLDYLRGIAVFLILIAHLPDQSHHLIQPNNVYIFLRSIGWVGVDIFFALSGFLISSIFYKEFDKNGKIDIKKFYFRRFFRIHPPLYTIILSIYIFRSYFVVIPKPQISSVLGEITFTQNYWNSILGITWSLAVEEHFYLIAPFLMNYFYRKNILKESIIGFILLFLTIRFSGYLLGESPAKLYVLSHYRFDSIWLGCLTGWYYHYKKDIIRKYFCVQSKKIILILILIFGAIGRESCWNLTFGYTMISILTCIWIINYCDDQDRPKLMFYFFKNMGDISYSLYLWHLPVSYFLMYYLCLAMKFNEWEFAIIYIIFSICFSSILYILIEKSALRLRNILVK
jgi:peptidoglycan/LPS O-acetylase OafA/YrhL